MRFYLQLIFLVILTQPVFAQVVLQKSADIPNRYIARFTSVEDVSAQLRDNKSKAIKALRLQQALRVERLTNDLQDTDLEILRDLWIKQSVAISLSSQFLPVLKALPYVEAVRVDQQYKARPLGIVQLPLSGEWVGDNLERIDIDSLWNAQYRGQGVVVAILDTGVDILHDDLASRWRGGTNSWFDPYQQQPEPKDIHPFGHGTAVSSIVLGGNTSGSYLGVAPNAQWIAARIFDDFGNSSESAISEVLQWVVDPDGDANTDDFPDIVQNSWGLANTEGDCFNPFAAELAVIDALGIDLVFAVGNSGSVGLSSYLTPVSDSHVVSVGALKITQLNPPTDVLLFSSSRGPDRCGSSIIPSVVAPGESIKSADLTFAGFDANNTSLNIGTSFSSPHVSGALALLRSQYRAQDHLQYRTALFDSAINLGAQDDYGRGLIQASAAATLLQQVTPVIPVRKNEVSFSNAVYVFSESETNATISVLRSGDISSVASVVIRSVDGTANSTDDYQSILPTSLNFAVGESVKNIVIQPINDALAEVSESFSLVLSQQTNINLGAKTVIVVTINDDDGPTATEDVIGGGSSGILELMFLGFLWIGMRTRQ